MSQPSTREYSFVITRIAKRPRNPPSNSHTQMRTLASAPVPAIHFDLCLTPTLHSQNSVIYQSSKKGAKTAFTRTANPPDIREPGRQIDVAMMMAAPFCALDWHRKAAHPFGARGPSLLKSRTQWRDVAGSADIASTPPRKHLAVTELLTAKLVPRLHGISGPANANVPSSPLIRGQDQRRMAEVEMGMAQDTMSPEMTTIPAVEEDILIGDMPTAPRVLEDSFSGDEIDSPDSPMQVS